MSKQRITLSRIDPWWRRLLDHLQGKRGRRANISFDISLLDKEPTPEMSELLKDAKEFTITLDGKDLV